MTASFLVVVGRIGRAHGVRGDVTVEVRTDEPERRFSPGCQLLTAGADGRSAPASVTVQAVRWHRGRLLLHLTGIDDRAAAEALRGLLLQAEIDPEESPAHPEEFYDHQLVGLTVVDVGGRTLGRVVEVVHGAQDLLVVQREPAGGDASRAALIPFVRALVPEVDLAGGRLLADLPDGLLDLAGE